MAGQLNYHINEKCVRVPNWNSVSYALEFSFYDWTIAEMAKAAGDMDTYDEFKARSYNSLTHWMKLLASSCQRFRWVTTSVRHWQARTRRGRRICTQRHF